MILCFELTLKFFDLHHIENDENLSIEIQKIQNLKLSKRTQAYPLPQHHTLQKISDQRRHRVADILNDRIKKLHTELTDPIM